jgi:MFS family permease
MTRDLKVLGLSVLIWGFADGMIFYFHPLYLSELGAEPSMIGGILGVGALLMALTQIPAGILADKLGRKRLLVIAWLLGFLSVVVMYLATTLTMFVLGFWLLFLAGFMFSVMASYVSASDSPWPLTRSLTTISAFYGIGTILGPLVGGQIAIAFELRTIYLVAIFASVLSTIIILFLSPQPILKSTREKRFHNFKNNTPLIQFFFLAFFVLFAMCLSWPLTPIYLQEIKLVSVGAIGLFGALNALGAVILNVIVGRLKSRVGFLIAVIFVGFSVIFIWKGLGSLWYGLGYFLAAGYRFFRVLVTGHVESYVTIDDSGLAYGIAETVGILTVVVSAPIAGFLYELRPELPFPVSLVMIIVSLFLILRLTFNKSPALDNTQVPDYRSPKEAT